MREKSKTYELKKEDIAHICNVLRRGTTMWKGRTECLVKSRKRFVVGQHKNGKAKTRWEYKCASCTKYYRADEVEVDHIVEIGPFLGDFNDYIKRMYCDQSNLQVLCVSCHAKKTSGYNATRLWKRKE